MTRFLAALALVGLAACDGGPSATPSPSPSPSATDTSTGEPSPTASPDAATVAFAASLEGTYAGRWSNTTFGSTGPARATITFDETESVLTIVFDVDGGVFGGNDPPAHTIEATVADRAISFAVTSDQFGLVTGSIEIDGRVEASLLDVPDDRVEEVQVAGTFAPSGADLTYTVSFADDSQAAGTLELDRA